MSEIVLEIDSIGITDARVTTEVDELPRVTATPVVPTVNAEVKPIPRVVGVVE